MKNIYLVVGMSGVGKTTLVDKLAEEYDGKVVLSYTDRERRYPNEGGHLYLTKDEFSALPPLVAYTEFDGHRYGVTADVLEQSAFYVIDPAGVIYLHRHYKGNKNIVVIGLTANAETLASRLQARDGNIVRLVHDSKIFTESVMDLICDYKLDAAKPLDELVLDAKSLIDREENKNE